MRFAVDLTTARVKGTMWDLCLEDDTAELRRIQNREQPELLVGSPLGDDFSFLLSTCTDPQEISKLRTERIEPQILGRCLLINDPRVYSIDGPMCRWSLKARGSKDKTEFMRKQTRWLTKFQGNC